LLEYWCMVDFVRPSYLGTKTEFLNMFERPIQNGQCIDSTPQDCKLMRYRAHVLHSLLKGFVQRRSHDVLQKCLPNKTEHVLLVRMTPFQRKLYTTFMNEVVRSKKVPNPLKAFAVCCKIWNHPDVLHNFLKKKELDLEIELEEINSEVSSKLNSSISDLSKKKNGTNKKEFNLVKEKNIVHNENRNLSFAKMEKPNIIQSASIDPSIKPPITPLSNDSAYSSNQSISNTFDNLGNCTNYFNYQNFEGNPYQSYNYVNTSSTPNYQNWNGSNIQHTYWQNNYYHSEYFPSNSYQTFYGNQNSLQTEQYKMPNNIVNTTNGEKLNTENKIGSNEGGLLADVIQKETKEQQEKLSTKKEEPNESIVLKNSREEGIPYDWAIELMKDYVPDLIENSPKMEIFFCILEESILLGDRLLVFSQSLLTLNLLERFLQRRKIPNSQNYWSRNHSYFRLDGSTSALEREKLINEFNANLNFKLFLVSTRAGSLGINLVGANRVIVFDASWNPCHDTQAVCRVYRYGQVKSCFVYRLVVDNCLEKKIYDRQINKQGMADRVVDECNPDAHLSIKEVTSLCYDDGEDPELKSFSDHVENFSDIVIQKILTNFSSTLTREPFHHESLLIDRKEKKLSQAEKRLAQRGYEMEKQAASKTSFNTSNTNSYRLFRTPDGTLIQRPISTVSIFLNFF
jgi:RAD54-like protein 2